MSYKFVSTQINQLVLFSKKLTKTIKKYKSDQIWSILINFDQIWSNLLKSDQKLFLIKIDQIWSDLIRFDQIWSDLYFFIFWKKYPVVLFKTETNRFMLLLFFFWHLPGLRLKGMFNLL